MTISISISIKPQKTRLSNRKDDHVSSHLQTASSACTNNKQVTTEITTFRSWLFMVNSWTPAGEGKKKGVNDPCNIYIRIMIMIYIYNVDVTHGMSPERWVNSECCHPNPVAKVPRCLGTLRLPLGDWSEDRHRRKWWSGRSWKIIWSLGNTFEYLILGWPVHLVASLRG